MGSIKERLDKVRTLIQDKDFLEGRGLSNEVNIRFFCYAAEEEMAVRHFVDQIKRQDARLSLGCTQSVQDISVHLR